MSTATTTPAPRRYIVETPYGTFRRQTHHTYTHVVVVCGRNHTTLENMISDAELRHEQHPPRPHQVEWLNGVRRELLASFETKNRNEGQALTWSHSKTKAQAAATRARRLHNVVGIFETREEAATK